MNQTNKPRQIVSWIEVQFDCPLPERECGVNKGESQEDHENYCNEELDYNFIRSACITSEHYENPKAGDTIKFIEAAPIIKMLNEMINFIDLTIIDEGGGTHGYLTDNYKVFNAFSEKLKKFKRENGL